MIASPHTAPCLIPRRRSPIPAETTATADSLKPEVVTAGTAMAAAEHATEEAPEGATAESHWAADGAAAAPPEEPAVSERTCVPAYSP